MSDKTQNDYNIDSIVTEFSGQGSILTIPVFFLKLCEGDHIAALFLSQLLYWQKRSNDPGQWVAKTYDDWYAELYITKKQIIRIIPPNKKGEAKVTRLIELGAETKVAKSPFYKYAPVVHYRVNLRQFHYFAKTVFPSLLLGTLGDDQKALSLDSDQKALSYNKDYTENTNTIGASAIENLINATENGIDVKAIAKMLQCESKAVTPVISELAKQKRIEYDSRIKTAYRVGCKPPYVAPRDDSFTEVKYAIIQAFNWDDMLMPTAEHSRTGKATKQLVEVGIYADEIKSLHAYCTRFDNISPMALPNHVSAWRKTRTVAPPMNKELNQPSLLSAMGAGDD